MSAVHCLDSSCQNLTHSDVLAEFIALALVRRFPRIATLAFVSNLRENPDIEVVWVNEVLHREAFTLLMERPDKTYSFCDAVSFTLMHQRGIQASLTTNHHFE